MNTFIAISYATFALTMLGTAEDSHLRNDRLMFALSLSACIVAALLAVLYYVGVFTVQVLRA